MLTHAWSQWRLSWLTFTRARLNTDNQSKVDNQEHRVSIGTFELSPCKPFACVTWYGQSGDNPGWWTVNVYHASVRMPDQHTAESVRDLINLAFETGRVSEHITRLPTP